MKKISKVSYQTQSGHDIVVRVTRIHEVIRESIWIDQEDTVKRIVNESFVEISLDGGEFIKAQYGKYKGLDTYGYGDDKTKRYTRIVIPSEKLEDVRKLQSERLIEDLSESERSSIEMVLDAVRNGKILPSSELSEKRRKYRMDYLEGGYGFNPYDYYITQEHFDYMKKTYPKEFSNL